MTDVDMAAVIAYCRESVAAQREATAKLEAHFRRYGILSCEHLSNVRIAEKVGIEVVQVIHALADLEARGLLTVTRCVPTQQIRAGREIAPTDLWMVTR